jgi:hypothetical protein
MVNHIDSQTMFIKTFNIKEVKFLNVNLLNADINIFIECENFHNFELNSGTCSTDSAIPSL